MDQLIDNGLIQRPGRPVLSDGRSSFSPLERMAEKSAQNVIDAIEASKTRAARAADLRARDPARRRAHGGGARRPLRQHRRAARRAEEELAEVPDVGPVVAESVATFFRQDRDREVLRKLKAAGIDPKVEARKESEAFSGKTVVFTGGLESMTREEAQGLVYKLGGSPSSSVSKKPAW